MGLFPHPDSSFVPHDVRGPYVTAQPHNLLPEIGTIRHLLLAFPDIRWGEPVAHTAQTKMPCAWIAASQAALCTAITVINTQRRHCACTVTPQTLTEPQCMRDARLQPLPLSSLNNRRLMYTITPQQNIPDLMQEIAKPTPKSKTAGGCVGTVNITCSIRTGL